MSANAPTDTLIHRLLRAEGVPATPWMRYAFAMALFAIGLGLRLALFPIGHLYAFSAFFPSVMVAAMLLGVGPGLLTTVLSAGAAAYLSTAPGAPHEFGPATAVATGAFCFCGVLMCGVGHVMRDALLTLRVSEQKFRALYESSGLGIVRSDLTGRFLESNAAFQRITGYTAEELTRLDVRAITPDSQHALLEEGWVALRTRGRFGPLEKEYRRKDGSLVPVRLQLAVVGSADGTRSVWGTVEDISEPRRVREENARLLREHRAVSESGGVGLVRVRNRAIVWANTAFAQMFGYRPEEFIGRSGRMFYPSDAEHAQFAAALQPVLARGGTFRTEIQQVRKSGEVGWFEVSVVASSIDGDEVIGAFIDTTLRRAALDSLARSEGRLRAMFTAMAEGLVVQAGDGTPIDANPAAEHTLGVSRADMLNRVPMDPAWGTLREDGSPLPGEEHPPMRALRTGLPVRGVTMGVTSPVRGVRWLSVNSQPIFEGGDGRPSAVVTTFVDITEARKLNAQLVEARADLQAILDHVPARIAAWNADLTSRFLNRYAERSFGFAPGAAIGRPMEEVVGATRYRGALPRIRAVLAGQRQAEDRVEVAADGTRVHMHIEFIPEFRDGQVIGLYALGTDVTALNESVERIRELAHRLETVREDERRRVSLSLHEGIAQELFSARLSVRLISAEVVGHDALADACRQLERTIDKCIVDTRQVANDLRPVALGHVRVARLLAQHAEYFGALAGLQIEVSEDATFPDLDEQTGLVLFRAAQEGLTNVARHARAKHAWVWLRADAEQIILEVADDGVGLDHAGLAKPGSLGLLGLRERIGALGGRVAVWSDADAGTTLRVVLPRGEN